MRGLKRKFGLGVEPARRKGMRWPAIVAFSLLGALLAASLFVYISRLSSAPGGDGYGVDGQYTTRPRVELGAPGNVSVSVGRGATISWDASEDARIIGYNVYRFRSEDDPGSKVNAAIVTDNVYHDDEGTVFNSYTVAPVDSEGMEGTASGRVAAAAEPASLIDVTPAGKPEKVENVSVKEAPARPMPAGFDGSTTAGVIYQGIWYKEHYAGVMGGAIMVTPYSGASATYTFSGDSIVVIATRHWNYGIMEVFIDGELRQQVDLYSPQVRMGDTVFSATGLGPGTHTIRLVCTGLKHPDANCTFINLEALQVR